MPKLANRRLASASFSGPGLIEERAVSGMAGMDDGAGSASSTSAIRRMAASAVAQPSGAANVGMPARLSRRTSSGALGLAYPTIGFSLFRAAVRNGTLAVSGSRSADEPSTTATAS